MMDKLKKLTNAQLVRGLRNEPNDVNLDASYDQIEREVLARLLVGEQCFDYPTEAEAMADRARAGYVPTQNDSIEQRRKEQAEMYRRLGRCPSCGGNPDYPMLIECAGEGRTLCANRIHDVWYTTARNGVDGTTYRRGLIAGARACVGAVLVAIIGAIIYHFAR
jgi:hypothetical protein